MTSADSAPSDHARIAADILPFESHTHEITAAGGRSFAMRYLDEGDRATDLGPILCVHGNPTWSFYYRSVVKRFSGTRRVLAVDHIGCGRSDKPSDDQFDYCLTSHRDNLLDLIRRLDLQRIQLVVHDWGGAIGLSAAVEEPDRFEKIVVLNTAAFPPPYIPLRIAACRWPVVGPLGVRGLNSFAVAAKYMTTNRAPLSLEARRGLIAPYDSWANRVAINAFVRDIPMHRTHRTFSVLEQLEQHLPRLSDLPIQLIWGMKDWCFRPECLERFISYWPHASVHRIADAGHYVLEDANDETLQVMDDFINGVVKVQP